MPQQSLIAVSPVSQDLLFTPDASFDIGKLAATRPRNIFASASVTAGQNVSVGGVSGLYWASRSSMFAPSDGVITLGNNASTDFNRLQFGGTTNAFPAMKRSGTEIQFRLADDSAYSDIRVNKVFAHYGIVFNQEGYISPSADGKFVFADKTGTSFGMIQLGGTDHAFPALKRKADTLEASLADDSAFTDLKVSVLKTDAKTVAHLTDAATAGAGARSFVTDALGPVFGAAVVGGGAVKVPVYSDGSAWLVG